MQMHEYKNDPYFTKTSWRYDIGGSIHPLRLGEQLQSYEAQSHDYRARGG